MGWRTNAGLVCWFNTWNLEPIAGELHDQQESVGSCGIDEGKRRLPLCMASSRIDQL
jgi:hypothetical protein